MRNIFWFTLLGVLLIGACQEAEEGPSDGEEFFKASLENEEWIGSPQINIEVSNDTLTVLGVGIEEYVYFRIKLAGEGVYELKGGQAAYYTTIGQDVITSRYGINAEEESSVTITKYKQDQQIIEGRFNIYLEKEWSNPSNEKEKLNFTNGQFKGEITFYE